MRLEHSKGFTWLNRLACLALALALAACAGSLRAEDEVAMKKKEKAKKEKKEEPKVPDQPAPAPAVTEKVGEPFHDEVVDFENAFAGAGVLMEVKPEVKHDYEACGKVTKAMTEAARGIVTLHEDRLRQYGNEYHHKLELLSANANLLNTAVAEHHRANIFTYWQQLKLLRDELSKTHPWQAPYAQPKQQP